ncbi:MAG: WbqC family protein [Bdellovibrionales bacterium]|nr:WbqC family protein [Bdellovibrionales bacterium]
MITKNDMKAAIIQSSYIPWKGYFDIIHDVDVFIFLDNVEFSKGSWRNRNKLKTPNGVKWISVPLQRKNLNHSNIDQVRVSKSNWQREHFNLLQLSYKDALYFKQYEPMLRDFYLRTTWDSLSEMNQTFIRKIAAELNISTRFFNASELDPTGDREERLINLCQIVGATTYLSGPSAKDYITLDRWNAVGIDVQWKQYEYPEYPQLHPPFDHAVTVLDMLFMLGSDAPNYIWRD